MLRFELFHNPGYTGRTSETHLIARGSSRSVPSHHYCLLIGRSLSHLARHFTRMNREVICIEDPTISRQTLSIRWLPDRGLEFARLSDSHGTKLYYREWGKTSLPLHDHVTSRSSQVLVRIGELGYWLRLEITQGNTNTVTRRCQLQHEASTLTQGYPEALLQFQRQFTCERHLWDIDHLLTTGCNNAHNKARRNMAWLIGTTLPMIAWPPKGWVLPQERESVTVRSRVFLFDTTNKNPTVAKGKIIDAITSMSLEDHISTVQEALQRIIEEDWLPTDYIKEFARRMNAAFAVDWEVSSADRIPCVPPFKGRVTYTSLRAEPYLCR